MDTSAQVAYELDRAEAARRNGNEGQARVCARRAAGIAARDFLSRRGVRAETQSAYQVLQSLATLPGLDADLRQAALYLTTRVSATFELPVDVDLIAEARRLCTALAAA